MAAPRSPLVSWWSWRRWLPQRRWRNAERAELRRELVGRREAMVDAANPPVDAEKHCGRGGQHLERLADGGPPGEVNLENPEPFAEARFDGLDRGQLHRAARPAARGREDDQRRSPVRRLAQGTPEWLALVGTQALRTSGWPECDGCGGKDGQCGRLREE